MEVNRIINININEAIVLEYTCNHKSCTLKHLTMEGENFKTIKMINDIDPNNIKKHGNVLILNSYGLDETLLYNVKLKKYLRMQDARYDGKANNFKCYIDAESDDYVDRAYFKIDGNTMKTDGFYSSMQGKFIPIYSEKEYKNDKFYASLDDYDKFVKRMKDTYEDKIKANVINLHKEKSKGLVKKMRVC